MVAAKKLLELDYPANLVTEPVLSRLIKAYDITVNIRGASITREFGYVQIEVDGEEGEIKHALDDLMRQGISVNPINKDVIE